jgi:hypothetical protein
MAKSMKLGGGGRFEKLSNSIQKKEGVSKARADAIAASIGRKKYGNEKFQAMAAKGKKKS